MARDTMLSSPSYADPLNVLNEANLLVEIEDEISIPQRIEPNDKEYCLRTYRINSNVCFYFISNIRIDFSLFQL